MSSLSSASASARNNELMLMEHVIAVYLGIYPELEIEKQKLDTYVP